jgi:hypothetical protein
MQLPHPLWFNHNIRTRNRLRNWEIRAIDLPPLSCAAGRGFGCVAKCAVHIACVAGEFAAAARDCAVGSGVCGVILDVWIRRRQGGECGFGQAEGFGQDGFWGAGEPVCEVECGSLSKFVSTLYDFGFGGGEGTQLGQNLRRQMREDTRSRHQHPERYAPDPWENTRCLRSLVQLLGDGLFRRRLRRVRGRRGLDPILPTYIH